MNAKTVPYFYSRGQTQPYGLVVPSAQGGGDGSCTIDGDPANLAMSTFNYELDDILKQGIAQHQIFTRSNATYLLKWKVFSPSPSTTSPPSMASRFAKVSAS